MKNIINISINNSDEVIEWLEKMNAVTERMLALIKKMPEVEINAAADHSEN